MKIDILRTWDDHEPVILGTVSPPEHYHFDTRSKDRQTFWQAVIENLWDQWQEKNKEPDTDAEFIQWLVQFGWEEVESNLSVTVGS